MERWLNSSPIVPEMLFFLQILSTFDSECKGKKVLTFQHHSREVSSVWHLWHVADVHCIGPVQEPCRQWQTYRDVSTVSNPIIEGISPVNLFCERSLHSIGCSQSPRVLGRTRQALANLQGCQRCQQPQKGRYLTRQLSPTKVSARVGCSQSQMVLGRSKTLIGKLTTLSMQSATP